MNKLKLASIVLAAVASTGLVFGSVGFSAVAADRGVSVSVASDEHALVGYQTEDVEVAGTANVTLVTVENRLPSDAAVTNVTVATNDPNVSVSNPSTPAVSLGAEETVQADVSCSVATTTNVSVSVTVEGEGTTAAISGDTMTRTFQLTCKTPGTIERASFNGAGNFGVDATGVGTTEITYWTVEDDSDDGNWTFAEHTLSAFDTSNKLQSQTSGGQPEVVAVYVPAFDTTYVHPNFDRDATPPIDDWGQGNQDADEEDGRYDPAE
jgi:hypothetical protein